MKTYQPYFGLILLSLLIFSCGEDTEIEAGGNAEFEKQTVAEIAKSKLQLFEVSTKEKQVGELISGRVIAKNETQLVSEVQGLILPTSISMKEGVRFTKGTQLLSIDSKEFALNLKSQKSAFLNAVTGIMPDLKSDYEDNFPAWLDYLENIDLEEPLAQLPETKSKPEKFFVTSRGLYTSFYSIKAQEERLKKYSIFAPYSGIVTQSMIDVGGLISPGQPIGTIISANELELQGGVSIQVGSQLKVGDKVEFTSNEVSGTWTGTLIRIGGAVDQRTQNIPVYFRITGKGVIPGMYLQARLQSSSYSDVFVIPSSALGRDQGVLVLSNDLIVSRPVETVQVIQDSTLVRGLTEKDLVILTQFEQPMAGKKVAL